MQVIHFKTRKLSWLEALGAAIDPFSSGGICIERRNDGAPAPRHRGIEEALLRDWRRVGRYIRVASLKTKPPREP